MGACGAAFTGMFVMRSIITRRFCGGWFGLSAGLAWSNSARLNHARGARSVVVRRQFLRRPKKRSFSAVCEVATMANHRIGQYLAHSFFGRF